MSADNLQERNAVLQAISKTTQIYSAACIGGSTHATETRKEAVKPREYIDLW